MAEGADKKLLAKLRKLLREFDERIHAGAKKMLRQAGEELASDIRERIIDGKDMDALHPLTIAMKGSSKPLIDDADLLGSVGVREIEKLAVAVGVNRQAEDGTNVAELHEREEGTRIKVTPKMRAFLAANGLRLKAETQEIFIPGRPFVKPAFEDFRARKSTEKLAAQLVSRIFKD